MSGLDWDELDEWEFLLGCLQEDASVRLAEMGTAVVATSSTSDGMEPLTAAATTTTTSTGPTIVQGVK